MISALVPFSELFLGEAYRPHPGDASLPIGKRFPNSVIVVVGGGGAAHGWTQRVRIDRQGVSKTEGSRSRNYKRGTDEWPQHLLAEAKATSGWCVILVEQQWQAALSGSNVSALEGGSVEQMLRVRESVPEFGDQKIAPEAIRAAIDHPTLDGSVVIGLKAAVIEQITTEAIAGGLKIASVRVATFALLERHFSKLRKNGSAPERTIIATDGQSAILVGIRDGALDTSEGGFSYNSNRPSEVRTRIAERISKPERLKEWGGRVEVLGSSLGLSRETNGIDIKEEEGDVVLAAVDSDVSHDLRTDLQEVRRALPRWVRPAFIGSLVILMLAVVGLALEFSDGLRLQALIDAKQSEQIQMTVAKKQSDARIELLKQEEQRARRMALWLQNNYHAQTLLQSILQSVPPEVTLDGLSFEASEGLPQLKLRFTLFGAEAAQRDATRAIETKLYQLGFDVGQRDVPIAAKEHRGGVVYSWDLIIPTFGKKEGQ